MNVEFCHLGIAFWFYRSLTWLQMSLFDPFHLSFEFFSNVDSRGHFLISWVSIFNTRARFLNSWILILPPEVALWSNEAQFMTSDVASWFHQTPLFEMIQFLSNLALNRTFGPTVEFTSVSQVDSRTTTIYKVALIFYLLKHYPFAALYLPFTHKYM